MVKLPEKPGFPAFVAQRIEHLTTDQKVGGSSPSKRTNHNSVKKLQSGETQSVRETGLCDSKDPIRRSDS